MTPYLYDAHQEFKRVDHLLFVSLKYTRTVDMLASVVDRFITCLHALIKGMLLFSQEKQHGQDVPQNQAQQAELFSQSFPQEKLKDIPAFFIFLRKLKRLDYKTMNEFRRHVTMSVIFPEIVINISIDKLYCYYETTKIFIEEAQEIITPTND